MEFSAWCVFWSRKPCLREWICTFNKDNLTTLENMQQKAKSLHRFRFPTNRTSHWLFPVVSRMSLTIFRLTVFTRHTWTIGTAEVQDFFFFQLQRTSLAFNVGCSTVELLVPNSANNRRLCLHKLYNHALINTIKRVLPLMWEYSCSSSKTLVAVKSSLHSVLLRWGVPYFYAASFTISFSHHRPYLKRC